MTRLALRRRSGPSDVEALTADLQAACGGDLRAVILYGSTASGDHHPRYSDVNVLVVLRDTSPAALAAAGPALRKWERAGHPAPLLMTPEFLAASADVFPLEFSDMKEQHRLLAGEDLLASLAVDSHHLRSELERELKGKLLRLRGSYAASAGDARRLRELLSRSSSTFLTLFRGYLRLMKAASLPPKSGAAAALGARLGLDMEPFAYAARLKAGEKTAAKEPPGPWAERYLACVEAVVERVDRGEIS